MAVSWAVRYRPRTFEQVVGQPEKAHLRLLLRDHRENFPAVLTFRGPSGTGKTTIARIVAAALNCTDLGPKADPCGKCDNCVAIHDNTFTGVWEHNAALENGADAMRAIQEKTFLYSAGAYNVFVLDEVQSLSPQAWKVLLKTFEEPAPGNVFILVTSEPNKIPRTIQTRSLSYDFGRVEAKEVRRFVEQVLEAERVELDGIDLLLDLAAGSVRDAVKMAQQCVQSGQTVAQVFAGQDCTLAMVEGLAANDIAAVHTALDEMWRTTGDAPYIVEKLATQWQRVLYQHFGIEQACTPDTQHRLSRVANTLGEMRMSLAMEQMAAWYPRTRHHVHLLFLVSDLTRVLHGAAAKPAAPAKPVPSASPVSVDQASAQLENLNFL